MKKILTLILISSSLLFSCNSNDDLNASLDEIGITITDDIDCCSAEEALQVYKFLQTVKIIPELSTEINGQYNVFAYSKNGSFHTGYNEIYFVATKKSTGNYVKDYDITAITPLMHMTQMDMYHSTPVGGKATSFNDMYLAVKRGWVSFVMNSGDMGSWTLTYQARVLKAQGEIREQSITVSPLSDGQQWIKSFKASSDPSTSSGQAIYYISLVNPLDWKTGTNSVQAYISKKNAEAPTSPWGLATERFTVDVVPTMPDMGNHTSPNNTPFTLQADGSYRSTLNLTMTGLWRLHLTVKDAAGNTVAGGDDLSDGFSSFYLDVTI